MTVASLTRHDTVLGWLLRLPLRLIGPNRVMTVHAGLNKGLKWTAGASTHGCWLGTYEREKQALIEKLVRPGMAAFDIGANAGFYTLAFSRLVGPSGRVCAFEPFAQNVENLLRHVRLNDLRNVTIFQAAVSDRSGMAGFEVHESNSMGSISQSTSDYCVPTIGIDQLAREHGLPEPDIIKVDVEGAEALVLAGATALLARGTATWLLELHGQQQADACAKTLRDAGYRIYTLRGQPVNGAVTIDEIYAIPESR